MQINPCSRRLLVFLLLVSTCLLVTYAKGGRGGGGRSGGSRGGSRASYSRPSYSRPAPARAPAYRPPAPAYRPPAPVYRPPPPPAPAYKPPSPPAVNRQPAYNPNYKLDGSRPAGPPSQPAYNPNYKLDGSRPVGPPSQPAYNPNYKLDGSRPAGPPPPYSPAGQPVPNAPVGPPPQYQSGASFGKPPPGVQPPPYPGPPVRPPAYPGLAPSHPQPVNRPYPIQPGFPGASGQSNINRPYPVQPGSYNPSPGVNRPYPVQPGSYNPSPGVNRPYPVQPGSYNPYPGVNRPYPQQSLGGNVWQPHHGAPAPAYMNYGGIPTGTNMYTKPHKKKGFIGSLMSVGSSKPGKTNKYYGSYPSPYGGGHMYNMGGAGGGFLGKYGSSASKYTIFPYMAARKIPKIHSPSMHFMPIFLPRSHYYHNYHHGHGGRMDSEGEKYYDVYNDNYVGKCQQPIKKNSTEIVCKTTFDEIQCDAKCKEGYKLPQNITLVSNKCWHVTGLWRPKKNFPECKPVCIKECKNGGECIRPEVCKCQPEFRGDQCQFHFLRCNILFLAKEEKISWVCVHTKNETVCKIKCKDRLQFETPSAAEYKCSPDGVWKPDTLPHCVVKDEEDLKTIFLKS